MKTLYLSDLDGTLLGSDGRISKYSSEIINSFMQNGGYFSYATARSVVSAEKTLVGLDICYPVICYNGTFIIDSITKEILFSCLFSSEEIKKVEQVLKENNINPIVYSYINGKEKFSFVDNISNPALQNYLNSRDNDPRRNELQTADNLYDGNIFTFSCIDDETKLLTVKSYFENDSRFRCIYQKEFYSGNYWFELYPNKASKANAALELKDMLNCERLIVFGDNINDIPMFDVADEGYAVDNSANELKEVATEIIDSNDNDAVARWIEKNLL